MLNKPHILSISLTRLIISIKHKHLYKILHDYYIIVEHKGSYTSDRALLSLLNE